MILSRIMSLSFLGLGLYFIALPGLAQTSRNEIAGVRNRQHWLLKNNGISPEKESAIFYVNKEDQGKILIFLGKQTYLLDTKYPSILRVTSPLPTTNGAFETGEMATEALKDMTVSILHVPGTPKFAGGTVWLGWSICFPENEKTDLGHKPGCYMFVRYEEDSPLGEQGRKISDPAKKQ